MNTTSPLQLNTASGINQRPNNPGNGGSDGSQFSAMLSGELERSTLASMPAPAPAPAPAPKQEASKPAEADKSAQPDEAAPQAARPADSKADAADAKDDTAKADDDKAEDDSTAKAGDPASAMLALMASLHKPGADAGKTTTAAQAFDALSGKGKRTDAGQLAALQAAMKSVSKEAGTDVAGARTFSATSIKNPALAAAGADLGADKAAASADLRAALGNVKAEVKPQLDPAEFSLQQARDAALLAQKEQAPVATVAAAQLQPAMLEAAQAAAAASEELSAHVGTDAWNDQVGQKVIYMVGAEDQTASLTLNPPDLGPLQVVLSVSNGQADVTFSANQLEVRQALENALPRLQEMMKESGIALGNATVNAGMSNGGQAQQDQAMASNGFGRRNNGRGQGGNDAGTVVGEATVRPATRIARSGDLGVVDTFA
ncbi:flagellar hook-length control protein FliK [Telluria mixta]|uniref:Flagellar hook-length control protein FliK n=1 Tax=Telluria mixta TaxID=34071 RepID=A0ABT2C5N6_9BURK|nr:flagellar hook-length control protein FliK [Telluria mixta]MCS0632697.1 flagellar hook-length control protein FliK [Telluria mixta]WEM99009.1 flagellar hook-length control protein FliK [Telluria mixta]